MAVLIKYGVRPSPGSLRSGVVVSVMYLPPSGNQKRRSPPARDEGASRVTTLNSPGPHGPSLSGWAANRRVQPGPGNGGPAGAIYWDSGRPFDRRLGGHFAWGAGRRVSAGAALCGPARPRVLVLV